MILVDPQSWAVPTCGPKRIESRVSTINQEVFKVLWWTSRQYLSPGTGPINLSSSTSSWFLIAATFRPKNGCNYEEES